MFIASENAARCHVPAQRARCRTLPPSSIFCVSRYRCATSNSAGGDVRSEKRCFFFQQEARTHAHTLTPSGSVLENFLQRESAHNLCCKGVKSGFRFCFVFLVQPLRNHRRNVSMPAWCQNSKPGPFSGSCICRRQNMGVMCHQLGLSSTEYSHEEVVFLGLTRVLPDCKHLMLRSLFGRMEQRTCGIREEREKKLKCGIYERSRSEK